MKTALVWTGPVDEGELRALIAAANAAGSKHVEIWLFAPAAAAGAVAALPVAGVVHAVDAGPWLAERLTPPLASLFEERRPDMVLFADGVFSTATAVRFAHAIGAACISSAHAVRSDANGITVTRPVLGMNLQGEFFCASRPVVISVAGGVHAPQTGGGMPAIVERTAPFAPVGWCEDYAETATAAQQTLADHDLVLIGGRGMGSAGMDVLRRLGEALDAGVGTTRPVALEGGAPLEGIVGVSGTAVSPSVCVVFGASGASPFVRGMEKSGVIVAVNNDPDAMIFKHCHFGVRSDCLAVAKHLASLAERGGTGG